MEAARAKSKQTLAKTRRRGTNKHHRPPRSTYAEALAAGSTNKIQRAYDISGPELATVCQGRTRQECYPGSCAWEGGLCQRVAPAGPLTVKQEWILKLVGTDGWVQMLSTQFSIGSGRIGTVRRACFASTSPPCSLAVKILAGPGTTWAAVLTEAYVQWKAWRVGVAPAVYAVALDRRTDKKFIFMDMLAAAGVVPSHLSGEHVTLLNDILMRHVGVRHIDAVRDNVLQTRQEYQKFAHPTTANRVFLVDWGETTHETIDELPPSWVTHYVGDVVISFAPVQKYALQDAARRAASRDE